MYKRKVTVWRKDVFPVSLFVKRHFYLKKKILVVLMLLLSAEIQLCLSEAI